MIIQLLKMIKKLSKMQKKIIKNDYLIIKFDYELIKNDLTQTRKTEQKTNTKSLLNTKPQSKSEQQIKR